MRESQEASISGHRHHAAQAWHAARRCALGRCGFGGAVADSGGAQRGAGACASCRSSAPRFARSGGRRRPGILPRCSLRSWACPFTKRASTLAAEAAADPKSGKAAETIEEAARRLRYAWFRQLMASGEVDAIATAHTLDDQAETVLAKFLRGAWTEGLAGIAPKLETAGAGPILRPLLAATHAEIEAYLRELGQDWREDSSNRDLTFTRNRIRHELSAAARRLESAAARAHGADGGFGTRRGSMVAGGAGPAGAAVTAAGASGARRRPRCRLRPRFRAGDRGEPAGGARSRAAKAAYPLRGGQIRRGARFFRDRNRADACARRPGGPEACFAARLARGEDSPRAAAVNQSSAHSKKWKAGSPASLRSRQFPAKSTRPPSGCGCASRLAAPRLRADFRMADPARRQRQPLCATGSPATASGSAIPPVFAR